MFATLLDYVLILSGVMFGGALVSVTVVANVMPYLERRKKVEALFEQHKPQVLLHFAAYAAEGLSPFIRNYNFKQSPIHNLS